MRSLRRGRDLKVGHACTVWRTRRTFHRRAVSPRSRVSRLADGLVSDRRTELSTDVGNAS
jgi:hypothetical protein